MQIQGMGGFGMVQGQDQTTKSLNKTSRDLSKILEKLSTSLRINRASDDAAGLAISEQLETQSRGFNMAQQNVTDATSALNIADSTGGQITDMLQQQRDLALQASNDTLTDQQRQGLDTQYQSLTQEINRISGSAQFNTQTVANGQGLASGNAEIQAGANGGDQIRMPATNMTAAALGINGTSIATGAGAQAALSTIDNALDTLNSQRTTVGSMTNAFQSVRNNLSIEDINTQAAQSVIQDQDMASGLADLTQSNLLLETGTEAFARYNEISANHLFGLLQ
ncbi:MAG: flagellin [Chitinivibrionales bacterium]